MIIEKRDRNKKRTYQQDQAQMIQPKHHEQEDSNLQKKEQQQQIEFHQHLHKFQDMQNLFYPHAHMSSIFHSDSQPIHFFVLIYQKTKNTQNHNHD